MKTFTATQLNKSAQEVFAAAKEEGTVLIEHDRFSGGAFTLEWSKDLSSDDAVELIEAIKLLDEIDINPDALSNDR